MIQPERSSPSNGAQPPADRRAIHLRNFSIASTALFLAILLVFNLVFDRLLSERLKWDWSAGQMYTIGEVSKAILEQIDQPVTITALFSKDQAAEFGMLGILPLLDEYVTAGEGQLTVRYIDPDTTPAVLDVVDPSGYLGVQQGDFVVTSQSTGKGKRVRYNDLFKTEVDYATYSTRLMAVTAEQSLTGAIQYVLSAQIPTVYFTTGHGELDHETDYSTLVGLLKNNNFEVRSVDLFGSPVVPADCSVLILADPRKDLTEGERVVIGDYLRQGGSLMAITSFNKATFPNLNRLLVDYDLALTDDRIREGDKDHRLNDDPYFLRLVAPASTITAETLDGYTLADTVRAVSRLTSGNPLVRVEPLLTTSEQGIIETDGDPAAGSVPSTQTIALLSENSAFVDGSSVTDRARVIVFGSSSLFDNQLIDLYGNNIYNAGLFFFSVQWLAGSDTISPLYIEAKLPPNYAVIAGTTTVNALVAILVLLLIPLAAIILALVVYRRRKNL
jgi:ABC-2 type transport system permease protein